MENKETMNGKKIMSGREFFKKWNAAKEKVDNANKAMKHSQAEEINEIPLF